MVHSDHFRCDDLVRRIVPLMTAPTRIRQHRRYSRRSKVTAVIAAEMTSVKATAEGSGIPATTIRYWMDEPEFVILRAKTREDIALETRTLAVKVLGEINRRIREFEPRDLSILYGVLTDKGQLLSGGATSRNETRDITDTLSTEEQDTLASILRDAVTTDAGG